MNAFDWIVQVMGIHWRWPPLLLFRWLGESVPRVAAEQVRAGHSAAVPRNS